MPGATPTLEDDPPQFPPTRASALARIAAIDATAYAATRNHLGGAVTRLSPYLAHGLVTATEVAAGVAQRQPLQLQHKLVQELGWRAFFHHVAHHRREGILASLHPGPQPEAAYAAQLPDDIRQARSGVPVVDAAVRALYASGWLHNHARMWLASYVVHVRGVHWRAGADWMLGHLVDGDRASNHLSWQWVAGTGSHQPYLFNAENVARWCSGSHPGWLSPGSVIDTTYEQLAAWARGEAPRPPARPLPPEAGVAEPPLLHRPPAGLVGPVGLEAGEALAQRIAGRRVRLVHPWDLAEPEHQPGPGAAEDGAAGEAAEGDDAEGEGVARERAARAGAADAPSAPLRLGVWPAEHFARWPWAAVRWHFVAPRLAAVSDAQVWADTATLQALLAGAGEVQTTDHPELPAGWPAAWRRAPPRFVPDPPQLCASFSQFWRRALRGVADLQDLPGWPAGVPAASPPRR